MAVSLAAKEERRALAAARDAQVHPRLAALCDDLLTAGMQRPEVLKSIGEFLRREQMVAKQT